MTTDSTYPGPAPASPQRQMVQALEEPRAYPTPEVPTTYPIPPIPSPILRYFGYAHLPAHLQGVSRAVAELAAEMDERLPPGPEKSVALRKLLEAKDAAVRAALDLPAGKESSSDPVDLGHAETDLPAGPLEGVWR